jgi:predicted amidohydrolase YtcJ
MKRLLSLLVALALLGCNSPLPQADLLVYNAQVYTVDAAFSTVEAVVIKDGKFVATGLEKDLRAQFNPKAEVDAEGRTIVPGLIDAHCHFYGLGQNQEVVNLVGTTSFDEVLQRVLDFQELAKAQFIYGRGWDQNDWEDAVFPNKSALDSLFPNIPVALQRVDGHALLVNQKALDLGGIDETTRVSGGEVILEHGKPTGVLVDRPMQLVLNKWPKPDRSAKIRALLAAEAICFENGLTTVNDAGLDREIIELIDSLQQSGDLSIRVYAMVSNTPENLDYFLSRAPYKTDRLTVRSVKVYADGALGSRGAALKHPYSDQAGHFGAMITPQDSLFSLAQRIAEAGYQMNTHAIGDSANIAVLRAYTAALKQKEDPRWKIEHAQILDTADFSLFGNKVLPSVQPTHATSDMYWAESRLGQDRMSGAYAYATLLQQSGSIALGTDFPVEAVDPIQTFYAAVTRMDKSGFPEGGFLMEEALTRAQALRGMTYWAAYSNFEEAEKGSIAPGKWADFTILSADIMTIPTNEIKNTKVSQTYIAGRRVF